MDERGMFTRLADVPVPRRWWWWAALMLLLRRDNRRARKDMEKVGRDTAEIVVRRWAIVSRRGRTLALLAARPPWPAGSSVAATNAPWPQTSAWPCVQPRRLGVHPDLPFPPPLAQILVFA